MKNTKFLFYILCSTLLFISGIAAAEPPADEIIVCKTNPHKITLRWNYLHGKSNYKRHFKCPNASQTNTDYCTHVHIPSNDWKANSMWCLPEFWDGEGVIIGTPILEPVKPKLVRLKHVSTSKCVYALKEQSTWKAYNWGCWSDPGMAFKVINVNSNRFKLRHNKSGLCLLAPGTNGSHVKFVNCSNLGAMIFTKEPTSNGKFRLKSPSNNKCLYGTPSDGGPVNVWGCWNDPGMEFTFENNW